MRVFFGFLLLLGETVSAQFRVVVRITNEDTRQPIVGASVVIKGSVKGGINDGTGVVSDSTGTAVLAGMGAGNYVLGVSCIGYDGREIRIAVPVRGKDAIAITLEPDVVFLGDVVVNSSRINGRIKDLPTRVEVLGTE